MKVRLALEKIAKLEEIHPTDEEIEEGAKHLLEIKSLVAEYNERENQVPLREPDLLMVITSGEMAYTRKDGVKVIPIACLKN